MSLNLNNLDDAEKFQKHFVAPLVNAVKAELNPLVTKVNEHEEELAKLKANQGRALAGFAAITLGLSTVIGLGIDWLKKKLGL